MRYLRINDAAFSKLVLGTDFFGDKISVETAFEMMDVYTEMGGNTLDTAHVYGMWTEAGLPYSEILVGLWMKDRKNRDKILLSTKGGHFSLGHPEQRRLDRASIESDLNASLKILGTDYVDMYWLHRDDESRPVEEICETLNDIVKTGKARLVGVSNWHHERIEAFQAYAREKHLTHLAASQMQWSLAYTTPELHGDTTQFFMTPSEYDWYCTSGLPVFGFSSQAKGFFAKGALGLDHLSERARHRYLNEENLQKLERVKEIAHQKGVSVTSVVLAYITCNMVPASAIFSSSNIEQLRDSMQAADVVLSQEEVSYLYQGNAGCTHECAFS